MSFMDFECLVPCDLHVFYEKKNYFVFISLFEGSRSSFSRFSKTSSCSSLLVEIFKQTTLSNLFFLKTPTFHGRLDGRSCSCMLYSENHFKLEYDWEDRNMRYTLDLIVISIGIIGFFQLVSILTSFCILICVLFVLIISLYFEHKF